MNSSPQAPMLQPSSKIQSPAECAATSYSTHYEISEPKARNDSVSATKENPSRQRHNDLNGRALAECGMVLKWLGFQGQHEDNYFIGQLVNPYVPKSIRILFDKVEGKWESEDSVLPRGRHIISLVAYALEITILPAARKLKKFLTVFEEGENLESASDIGLPFGPIKSKIIPAPAHALPIPKHFGWLGEPDAVYAISSSPDTVHGYILRFNDFTNGDGIGYLGDPYLIPLTYCEAIDGTFSWRTQSLPPPHSLYGAQKLTDNPLTPVLLTQDERSADRFADSRIAATKVNSVALITSPNAIENTDLSPIAGRTIYILPNTGEDGEIFAAAIQKKIWEINPLTPISVIATIAHRKQHAPDSPIPQDRYRYINTDGWSPIEIINWAQEQKATLEYITPKPQSKYPDCTFGDFVVKEAGIHVQRVKNDRSTLTRIASRIAITAYARTLESNEWGVCMEFRDPDGVHHTWCAPRSLFGGDPSAFCKPLLSMGAFVSLSKADKDDLGRYFITVDPGKRALSVSRSGWINGHFVFPDNTIIGPGKDRVVFQTTDPAIGSVCKYRGTLKDWQDNIGQLCNGNSRLVIAVCVALAGPVLALLGEENGGLHLVGESSSGKTTALFPAASVWGPPAQRITRWRATANGLESIAVQYNDTVLILDEMSQASPQEVGSVIYMLMNGQGKVRANQTGGARQTAHWQQTSLSTGEVGVKQYIESGGGQAMAGQQVRLIDIAANAGAGLGTFENIHSSNTASEFALLIKARATESYGTAGRAWVKALASPTNQEGLLNTLRTSINDFAHNYVSISADGQVHRVGRRFGMFAAVGEACIEQGILPWPKGQALDAARKCFLGWIETRGGIGNIESGQALEQVKRFLETHGESRFTELGIMDGEVSSDHRITGNRAGFRKVAEDGHTDFYILPEAYRTQICAGLDPKQVTSALVSAGALILGNDGKPQITKRLPGIGKTARVYQIRSTIMDQASSQPLSTNA